MKSYLWWIIFGIALLLVILMGIGLLFGATGTESWTERLAGGFGTEPLGGGGVGQGACANIPEPYQTILTRKSQQGPWKVRAAFLAAIGQVESTILSRNPDGPWATSPKGAQGPFQFLTSTWRSNGRDGGGSYYRDDRVGIPDGNIDIQSIWDSSLGATKLLANNGADGNTSDLEKLRDAASRYNSGRSWAEAQRLKIQETLRYVPEVINLFLKYSCVETAPAGLGSLIFPIPSSVNVRFSNDWLASRPGHQHAGTDIIAPRGAPVIAVVSGTIERVGLDGFAPNQYKFTINPHDGSERGYYYAHVRNLTIRNGSMVQQGDQLAEVGVAAGVAHLHFGIKVPEGTPGSYFYSNNWWVNPYPILKALRPK